MFCKMDVVELTLIYSFTVAAEVEAAKAAANESTELAIQKRKEAQSLAENADLAVYKATMLVRMTEATQAGGSVDALAGQFLD